MSPTIGIAIGLCLGVPLTWLALRLGKQLGLLDLPVGIKVHRTPVPYTGGAAIVSVVVIVGVVLGLPPTMLFAAALMWAIGLVDDVRSVAPRTKLILESAPLIVGVIGLGLEWSWAISAVVFGLFVVNAFNVIDGLDGLAAGVALISLLLIAVVGPPAASTTAAVLIGALAGFLVFNLNPARIFLGDEGSLALGFFLWFLPLQTSASGRDVRTLLLGTALVGFPVLNTGFVLVRRMVGRRPLLTGGRDHFYDVLRARWGLRMTLLICWSITGASILAGALALGV